MNKDKHPFFLLGSYYCRTVFILYGIFLFCVLSIGRAFSVVHVDTPWVPLYSTELFLCAVLAFILTGIKRLYEQYKSFFIILLIYCLLGFIHLFAGLKQGNLYALRDIILCSYALFTPLTMLVFFSKDRMQLFIKIIIAGNAAALIAGRFYLIETNYPGFFHFIEAQSRATNFGLSYCFALCFLLPLFDRFSQRWQRLSASVLISLDVYMVFLFGKRAIWLALLVLFIYFLAVFRKQFLMRLVRILPFFIVIVSLFYFLDFRLTLLPEQKKVINAKIETTQLYIAQKVAPKKKAQSKEKAILKRMGEKKITGSYRNITWRSDIWRQAIAYGLESPLFGRGFGNYPPYVIRGNAQQRPKGYTTNSRVIPAHNQFVTIFYKMGFVGLFLFLFLNGYIFWKGIMCARHCTDALPKAWLFGFLGCFLAWHTIAFSFDVIDSPPTSIFLWIIMGGILSVIAIHKKALP